MADVLKPFSADRMKDVLEEADLVYYIDRDGDFMTLWEDDQRIYFRVAEEGDHLLVTGVGPRAPYSDETREMLLEFVNNWNRTKLFGKAFVSETGEGDDRALAIQVDDAYVYADKLVGDKQLWADSVGSIAHIMQLLGDAEALLGE